MSFFLSSLYQLSNHHYTHALIHKQISKQSYNYYIYNCYCARSFLTIKSTTKSYGYEPSNYYNHNFQNWRNTINNGGRGVGASAFNGAGGFASWPNYQYYGPNFRESDDGEVEHVVPGSFRSRDAEPLGKEYRLLN